MLRFTPALAALLTAASVSAQQAGAPQPGSPQRPAQTTGSQGADANQTQNRNNAQRPNANQGAQADPNQSVTPPRNDVPDRADRQQARRGNRQAQSGDRFDAHVADCLIMSNQEEIALLKFGMEHTKTDKVKQLAQSMIQDHEKAISELREFASPQHANEELTASRSGSQDVASTREARKVPADNADDSNSGLMAKMHRMMKRAHEQCLVLNREELSKYQGHEFDQAFLGAQLGAHINMLAHLKAAQEETSGELSQWTGKAQETTKNHKDHLEKLMNDLAKDAHSSKK
jgi:predicted outer membrane protein